MGTSHGLQVGPSTLARFEYDNPLTRELLGLTTRLGALELRQEELGHSLDHNTSLTQESWGMLSSLSYDWHHGAYYPRHIQTSSPKLHSSLGGRNHQYPGKLSYPFVQLS